MRVLFLLAIVLAAAFSYVIMPLPARCEEHLPPVNATCRRSSAEYPGYLTACTSRMVTDPEALSTVRPLSPGEYDAVVMALELVKCAGDFPDGGEEGRRLSGCHQQLRELLGQGRIKGDDDPLERRRGTKMTTHRPGDLENPCDGDIYIHEEGLLENVTLPRRALGEMGEALPAALRQEKSRKYLFSIVEGVVLLSSCLVHECAHRGQAPYTGDPHHASPAEIKRYIETLEDPAYSAQLRYLMYLYRITDYEGMRQIVKATGEALIVETNTLFPGLKEFRGLQCDGMWQRRGYPGSPPGPYLSPPGGDSSP